MAKYSKKAGEKVENVMQEEKLGELKSGLRGKKVTSGKPAIVIGNSEARHEGAKVTNLLLKSWQRKNRQDPVSGLQKRKKTRAKKAAGS